MWRLSTNREYLGIVLCLFCYTVDATSQKGAVGGLQEALESQGWQSTTMPDGSRIFTRPGSTAVEPAPVVDRLAVEIAPAARLADDHGRRRQYGYQATGRGRRGPPLRDGRVGRSGCQRCGLAFGGLEPSRLANHARNRR